MKNSEKDRIEGNTIIIHDDGSPGPRVLKTVEIIRSDGSKKVYRIKKTLKQRYLFN